MIRVGPIFLALSAVCSVLPSASVQAACVQWDLSSVPQWMFQQSNGYRLYLTFQQHSNVLGGHANATRPRVNENPITGRGTINGNIAGNTFEFTVEWSPNNAGVYTGSISEDGTLKGNTRDKFHPEQKATWFSMESKTAKCIQTTAPAAPPDSAAPAPKPVKRLGKRLPGTSTTSDIPQSQVAKAKDDVDIYKGPGGEFGAYQCGPINCFMNKDETAKVLWSKNGWYQVQTNKVPGGSGWIAADHLTVTTF